MVSFEERTAQVAGILRVLDVGFQAIHVGQRDFTDRGLFVKFLKKYIDKLETNAVEYTNIDMILYMIETKRQLNSKQTSDILYYLTTVMSVTYEWQRIYEGGGKR